MATTVRAPFIPDLFDLSSMPQAMYRIWLNGLAR